MKQITRVSIVMSIAIGLVVGVLALPQPASPQAFAQEMGEMSDVQPAMGYAGTTFAFYATGFDEDETVDVWLNAPDGRTLDVDISPLSDAPSDGRVDWKWTAPADIQAGWWQMVARGRDSGLTHTINVEIAPGNVDDTAPPDISADEHNVQPRQGHPGTTFAFYATGFDEEETVDVWLNVPDGQVIDADVSELYEASPTGRADWRWTAPDGAVPGWWQMVAQGRDSGVVHVIHFEISPGVGTYEPPETDEIERYNVEPEAGPPGTTFAFYATGFDVEEEVEEAENAEAEDVEIWVESPDWVRSEVERDNLYVAPPSGRVDWTWTAPANAQRGIWHMVIVGEESQLKHVIPFEVY